MTGYERHNSHIAYFLGGNIMWIKKNNLLVNLEKFDALYQDTLHPENLVIMTDRKKRTLAKIPEMPLSFRPIPVQRKAPSLRRRSCWMQP